METLRKTHPMILVAAASVSSLSLAGVASLAGWMPTASHATSTTTAPLAAVTRTESPATISVPPGATITVEPKAAARATNNRSAAAPRADARPPTAWAAPGRHARAGLGCCRLGLRGCSLCAGG